MATNHSIRLTRAVYGCILTLAVTVALEGKIQNPLLAVVIIIVSLAAVAIAEAYAHLLGSELATEKTSTLAQIRGELRAAAWLILPGLPAITMLLGAAAGLNSIESALFAGQIVCCAALFGAGFLIRFRLGGSIVWSLVDGLAILSVGLAVVALKFLTK